MRLLASLFLLTALTATALGQNAPITIGPGVMSFPDIARKLSADGRTVVCASSLRESAAVVSLKKRSWSDIQELLGAGLDVRFTAKPETPNTWLMERDPAVVETESRTRRALAAFCKKQMAVEMAPYTKHLDQPIHVRLERMMALQHALTQREKEDPEHKAPATKQIEQEVAEYQKDSDPFSAVAARIGNQLGTSIYESAIRAPMAFQAFDINRVANVKAITLLMLREMEWEQQNRQTSNEEGEVIVGNDIGGAMFRQILQEVNAGNISVLHRLHFDPADFRVTAQQMYILAGRFSFRDGITVGLLDDSGYPGVLRNLGDDYLRQFDEDQRRSKEWLKTAQAQRVFNLSIGLQISSLSQVIEGWARSGSEVVMELAPYREDLAGMEEVQEDEEAEPRRIASISLAKMVSSNKITWPWSFTDRKGTLLVKNGFSFLDHYQVIPIPALLRLESMVRPKTGEPKIGWNFQLSEVIEFHQPVTPAQSAALGLIAGAYRGMPVRVLAEGRFASILKRLAPRQREMLEKELAARGEAELPMSYFLPRDLSDLAATIRAAALASENDAPMDVVFLQNFEQVLATGRLKLKPGEQEMTISLTRTIKEKDEPDEITSVTISKGIGR